MSGTKRVGEGEGMLVDVVILTTLALHQRYHYQSHNAVQQE